MTFRDASAKRRKLQFRETRGSSTARVQDGHRLGKVAPCNTETTTTREEQALIRLCIFCIHKAANSPAREVSRVWRDR